jgi:hypothetical protein
MPGPLQCQLRTMRQLRYTQHLNNTAHKQRFVNIIKQQRIKCLLGHDKLIRIALPAQFYTNKGAMMVECLDFQTTFTPSRHMNDSY